MDSETSDSTDSDDFQITQNHQFNNRQLEQLLICLKGIIEKVVKLIQSNRNYKIKTKRTKKKAKKNENGNVASNKADRFRKDIHELCRKIHNIGSASQAKLVPGNSRRDAEVALPGTSKSVTGIRVRESTSHKKTDVYENTKYSGVAMSCISKRHIKATPHGIEEESPGASNSDPNAVASTPTNQAEPNISSKGTALSKTSSTLTPLASGPSRRSSDIMVSKTLKRRIETEVTTTATMPLASPETPRSCIEKAVPVNSSGISKADVSTVIEATTPAITRGDVESVAPRVSCPVSQSQAMRTVPTTLEIPILVLKTEKQISLVEVNKSDIQRNPSEVVISTAKESDIKVGSGTPILHEANRAELPITRTNVGASVTNTKTIVSSTSTNSHKEINGDTTSKKRTERHARVEASKILTKLAIPVTPRTHTKAALDETARGGIETEITKTLGQHIQSATHKIRLESISHKNPVPTTSRSDTVTSKTEIKPELKVVVTDSPKTHTRAPVSNEHRYAVVSNTARYNDEKVPNASIENGHIKSPGTTSATKEVVTPTSTDHRQIIEVGNSNHKEILNNALDSRKRRKSQDCDRITRINDGARVNENKKKKHNLRLTKRVNKNNEVNDRNLQTLEPIANNQTQENTNEKNTEDTNTNPNMKKSHVPPNNAAKISRIHNKCTICSKPFQFDSMEEHYKKEHNIHHEIKHNNKYYEHKIKDLHNRCHRRASKCENTKQEPKGRQEPNQNMIESKDPKQLELDITASNVRLEPPIANFTYDKITETDGNMTIKEERNRNCADYAIDLTSDDNDENKVINKAAPEAKGVEDDQVLNEHEIIHLSDDVLMYDTPADKDRSIKTDTSNSKMNNNIENSRHDVKKEDSEIALAEELLIANVKNEQAKEQKDENEVINKAAPEAKGIEVDQVLNEHEIIHLSDDVLMYDTPADKDRSIKNDTSNSKMNNNIENSKHDVKKEDSEIALAEELLIANVKNEQAKEQKDEEEIVKSVFFNGQPNNKKSGEKRKHAVMEKRRDRQNSHSNLNDKNNKIKKPSKQQIDNYVKNTILTSALVANNIALEVTVSDSGSTSALQIQKDGCEPVEKHNTTESQAPTVSSSPSVSSIRSLPIPISSSLSISVIPSTSVPVSILSSNTESSKNAKQSAENLPPQTPQMGAAFLTPVRDSVSKFKKHKNKFTTAQNVISIGSVSETQSSKQKKEGASAQYSLKHTSKGNSDLALQSRRHKNKSTFRKGGNSLNLYKPLKSMPVIQFRTNVTSTTPLFSLPSTSSAESEFTNSGPSKTSKYFSERPTTPKQQNVNEKPVVKSTYSISPNISITVPMNSRKRTESIPLQPTLPLPQSGTNIPSSTSQSISTPTALTAVSQSSIFKPTNTTAMKLSNQLTDPRISILTQQSLPRTGSNILSTAHSTPTSVAGPSKSNPTCSSKHYQRRDSVPSASQLSAFPSASRIRSPSTDSRPTQLNSVSTSSRRASVTNIRHVGHPSSNPKCKQHPQTAWHTPVPVEIESTTPKTFKSPVSMPSADGAPYVSISVSNSEPRPNLPSQPIIITPRAHSTMIGNLTTPTTRMSWHIPEDRPGITRQDQPEIEARK